VLASPGVRVDDHDVHLPAWGYAWVVETSDGLTRR
jgi:hypothetical protein